ncbi:MAG TPA: ribonuclease P protein component [Acidimicrobiia bacterium]|nr:ribonuclease P protein component [Acidimicrobiia bacterium]
MPRVAIVSRPDGRGFVSLRPASRFAEVYRTGVRTVQGGIVVIESTGHASRAEVGFVAGRKVGTAVRRNRAKRRMREAARHVPFRAGRAYVVVASPSVADVPFEDLVAWMTSSVTPRRTQEKD